VEKTERGKLGNWEFPNGVLPIVEKRGGSCSFPFEYYYMFTLLLDITKDIYNTTSAHHPAVSIPDLVQFFIFSCLFVNHYEPMNKNKIFCFHL
jgi:hypothetical protein